MKQVHRIPAVLAIALLAAPLALGQGDSRPRARDIGLSPGVLDPGPLNAITDVPGVLVGQVTLMEGDHIRTGVTAILPHAGNVFQEKVPGRRPYRERLRQAGRVHPGRGARDHRDPGRAHQHAVGVGTPRARW